MTAVKRTKKTDHGPECIACTDPAKAAEARARRREQIENLAAKAREHRAEGERIREEEYRKAHVDTPEFADAQGRMRHHLGTANALFQRVQFWSADLERIEQAHGIVAVAE